MNNSSLKTACATVCAVLPVAAFAQADTATYSYDALGRVIEVESERSADTVTFEYEYDDADNRTSSDVTEVSNSAAIEEPTTAASGQMGQPQ